MAQPQDAPLSKEGNALPFIIDKHKEYIKSLSQKKDNFEHWVTEHLRMSGLYWGLCALDMLNALDELGDEKKKIIAMVQHCQHENGGFGGNIGHDPHLLYTLSAVQILAMLDALDKVNTDKIVSYVASLQQPDGSFSGDEWGEIDTR